MEKTNIKDNVGNSMEKHLVEHNIKFKCKCGQEMKKGDNIYQFYYTEPICEKCFKGIEQK